MSGIAASSLPVSPRISARESTGNIGRADTAPHSKTARWAARIGSGPRMTPFAATNTRPSQVSMFIAWRLKSAGALRWTNLLCGCTRSRPRPVAPWPMARLRPSTVAFEVRWHVMQEMSRLPLSTLSKASA